MAVFSHFVCLGLVALVMASFCFSTVEMSTERTRIRRMNPDRYPRVEPLSPGGYRTYIVFLYVPTGGVGAGCDDMDAHRAWHESFLPTNFTRDGQRRLRLSYCVIQGFSALLTPEEAERVAQVPGVAQVLPNGFSHYLQGKHRRASLALE